MFAHITEHGQYVLYAFRYQRLALFVNAKGLFDGYGRFGRNGKRIYRQPIVLQPLHSLTCTKIHVYNEVQVQHFSKFICF